MLVEFSKAKLTDDQLSIQVLEPTKRRDMGRDAGIHQDILLLSKVFRAEPTQNGKAATFMHSLAYSPQPSVQAW